MTGTLATYLRELRAYFFSPLAYIVLTVLLLVNGGVFWLIVKAPRTAAARATAAGRNRPAASPRQGRR